MGKNQLKSVFRILKKQKVFMIINIRGLALGIWCSLLIVLWVQDEFKQDHFHTNGDTLYQVLRNVTTENAQINTEAGTAYPIADALLEQIPEIRKSTRYTMQENTVLDISNQPLEADLAATDPDFFTMFSFPLREGERESCLSDLHSIVISEQLANSYFPNGNAIGKTVELKEEGIVLVFNITGVFKKMPQESSLQFDAVIPIQNYLPYNSTYKSWGNSWMVTYVQLEKNASVEDVNKKIAALPKKLANVQWFKLLLQPFKDRYLYSKFENGKIAGGRIDTVILFSVIAIFTLLIACFNFINLTTAWSVKRSKEVGIKKVMGAGKGSLIAQFILESVVLVLTSLFLAVVLTKISLPMFNTIASKELALNFGDFHLYIVLFVIGLVTVMFSGIYPAIFLSSFNAIRALKGRVMGNMGQTLLRKGLVIFQFGISMILVAGTLIVYLQFRYIQNKDLGLDKENIIYMPMDVDTWKHADAVKAELSKFADIKQVSATNTNFVDAGGSSSDPQWEGKSPDAGQLWFSILDVDFHMMEMLDIKLAEGRLFSSRFATDTLNYMVNEEAAKLMGMKDPVGKSLSFWGDKGGKIVGVVKNFHFTSLHDPIAPMIIRCRPSNTELVYIKSMPGKTREAIADMEGVHNRFSSLPFTYHFLDEAIEKGYKEDRKVQKLAGSFAVLAIFISCLGLFGLASFTIHQRKKEIAVRKVLGASAFRLFYMLSQDYIKLIVLSLAVAVPFAWYAMNRWINGFAYHVEIRWWMFGMAGLAVLSIALSTVSYQSLKYTRTNPVKNLRTE